MKADDTMAVNAKTFRKIAKMIRRLVDHIRKEKSLPEKLARETFDQIDDLTKEALIVKPRNCDIGTAEEQVRRYHNFTGRYNPCSYKGYARCAEDCPVHKKLTQEGHGELLCQLEWAQMPYDAKEGDEK